MLKKNLFLILPLLFPCFVFSSAVNDLNLFVSAADYIKGDLEKLAGFVDSEFSKQIIFNATSASFFPSPSVNFGGFESGSSFGVSFANFNKDGLYSLNFDYFQIPFEEKETPALISLPVASFHVKSGLPEIAGMPADAGIKFLALDAGFRPENASIRVRNYMFGLETRMQLLSERKEKPFSLLASLSFDFVSGRVNFSRHHELTDHVEVNGTLYDFNIEGNTVLMADWKAASAGLKAIISREFFFFNPYAGFGLNINAGRTSTTAGVTGNISMTNTALPSDNAQSKAEILGRFGQDVNPIDFRMLAGFELGIGAFKLGFGYEYGGEIFSLSSGMRLQF